MDNLHNPISKFGICTLVLQILCTSLAQFPTNHWADVLYNATKPKSLLYCKTVALRLSD